MNPYRLLGKGKYDRALRLYKEMLVVSPNDEMLLDGYPFACLCNGLYEEALEGFLYSNRRAKNKIVGERQPYLMHVGTAQWLLGRREEAIATFRAGVDGILDGTIEYADLAGGARQGLLLWFAGICAPDAEACSHAIRYMQKLANEERIKCWPGPIAEYAINKISTKMMFQKLFGYGFVWWISMKAKINVCLAFELATVWFYLGIKCLEVNNQEGFQYWLKKCYEFNRPNPMLEWYLAKAELERRRINTP